MKSSHFSGSRSEQSASFPGSEKPSSAPLRSTRSRAFRAASRALNAVRHFSTIRLASELPVEEYAAHRRAGGFLVIDPQSGATLAAGIVTAPVTRTADLAQAGIGTHAGISGTSTTTTDTEGAAA